LQQCLQEKAKEVGKSRPRWSSPPFFKPVFDCQKIKQKSEIMQQCLQDQEGKELPTI
jgi:hypothetical protein